MKNKNAIIGFLIIAMFMISLICGVQYQNLQTEHDELKIEFKNHKDSVPFYKEYVDKNCASETYVKDLEAHISVQESESERAYEMEKYLSHLVDSYGRECYRKDTIIKEMLEEKFKSIN